MKLRYLGMLTAAVIILATAYFVFGKKTAPDVSFTTTNGQQIALSAMQGHVVLVNFWATSCSGCMQEMPELIKIQKKYTDQGYKTLSVAMSYDNPEYIENYRNKMALPFIVTHDKSGEIAKKFGDVTLTPTSFLLDKNGQIIKQYIGIPNMDELENLIKSALAKS
ncbi:hypothetical protein JHS3_25610 [Jeongeupia sp. HS-3]|uniref:peroxiredoxin family protein n=1 Tax=Jeongeupia sp. HS-3 TaxID=1009682 RepID=UPI0018A45713|nr:TlpA disulfide reductase family protein [Jeongeupia sp. HS-3]BCL76825.1 hypothetical protein JHS3_25610 [Jeongeupia sp. HS-3]